MLDAQRAFFTWLLLAFAALAVGLAGSVALRGGLVPGGAPNARDRRAHGARPSDVTRLVVADGLKQAGVGVAVGLVAAFGLTRLLEGQLYDVHAHDPATYLVLSVLLVGLAALASAVPARRAAHTDPARALSEE